MKVGEDSVTQIVFHVEFEKEFSFSIDPSLTPLFTIQFTLGYYKSGEYVQTTYTKDVYNLYANMIENFVGTEATDNDYFFLIDLGVHYTDVSGFEITNPKIISITDNSYIYKVKSGTSKFVSVLYSFSYTNQGDFTIYDPTIQASLLYGPTYVFQSVATETDSNYRLGSRAILRSRIHDEYNDPLNTSYYFEYSNSTNTSNRYIYCTLYLDIYDSTNTNIGADTDTSQNITVYPKSPGGWEIMGNSLVPSDINEVCWIKMSGVLMDEIV